MSKKSPLVLPCPFTARVVVVVVVDVVVVDFGSWVSPPSLVERLKHARPDPAKSIRMIKEEI